MNHLDQVKKYFNDLTEKHGDHFLGLDWKSPDSQDLRFQIFADLLVMCGKKTNFSILDVGCGYGDFYGYLKRHGYKNFNYSGYDVSEKVIEVAKKKYKEGRFEIRDILTDGHPEVFDFVFCSGALTIHFVEDEDHLEFIRIMLNRMFELCKIGVGVNFLSSEVLEFLSEEAGRQPQYYYAKAEEIIGIAKKITSRFVLRHDYHPGDFTVYLIK